LVYRTREVIIEKHLIFNMLASVGRPKVKAVTDTCKLLVSAGLNLRHSSTIKIGFYTYSKGRPEEGAVRGAPPPNFFFADNSA
jgi:hypothetical protein